jgi:hypothetical protein
VKLSDAIGEFLRDIYSKPEDDRTGRDNLLIATGEAFLLHLRRHETQAAVGPHNAADKGIAHLLTNYIDINRDYDLLENDAKLAGAMRAGRRGGK